MRQSCGLVFSRRTRGAGLAAMEADVTQQLISADALHMGLSEFRARLYFK